MGFFGGENYRLELDNANLTSGGNGPAEIKLFDSEGNERTLESWEYIRLVSINVQMANAVGTVEIFDDVDDGDDVDEGERLLQVGTNSTGNDPSNHDVQFSGEGKRLSRGRRPKVLAASAGQVTITGVAYVHVSGDRGQRPPWKEADFGQ